MKIQSKFKDYYDFVSHQFGQDPDVVYRRGSIWHRPGGTVGGEYVNWTWIRQFSDPLNLRRNGRLEFIVAGPHVAPILYSFDNDSLTRLRGEPAHLFRESWGTERPMLPTYPTGETLNSLIRAVGAPVFRCAPCFASDSNKILVYGRVPVLKDFGFPTEVPPEQMWQDIYSTLTTVLRKNPDKEPPVTLANDDRIHAAGFDLKTSFRHPVNPRKVK